MDDTEFADLYRASARQLVGLTYPVCGDVGEAQDCVQEAFVRAWVRRRRLDVAGHPEAWVRVTSHLLRGRGALSTALSSYATDGEPGDA